MATVEYRTQKCSTAEDMLSLLKRVEGSQDVIEASICSLQLKELANAPIVASSIRTQMGFAAEEEDILACMPTNVMLSVPVNGKQVNMPIYYTAMRTLRERAKLYGKTAELHPLILNEGFPYYTEDAKLLIQDKVLLAAHSMLYQVLPQGQLFEMLLTGLDYHMGGYSFIGGEYAREMTIAAFEFPQKASALASLGVKDAVPGLYFTTNDIGQSGANLQATMIREQNVSGEKKRVTCYMGSSLSTTHDKKHDVSDFGQQLDKVFALIKDGAQQLERLKKIKLQYPAQCFMNVTKELHLPKKEAQMAQEDFTIQAYMPTAYDLYWMLWNIVTYLGSCSVEKRVSVQENISRAAGLRYEKYDVDYAI